MTNALNTALANRGDQKIQAPKKKKDQLSLAQWWGLTPLRTGPIPKAPGGWGLRNPEPKGPGQRSALLFARPHGVPLAEVGRYCDSANDPVTTTFAANCYISMTTLLQSRAVGAIMQAVA
jgi:hypothetical protein